MYYIDSHTHLFLDEFNEDRKDVIERSIFQGIQKMILPNVDSSTLTSLRDTCQLAKKNLFPAIGLHPCSVKDNFRDELDILSEALKKDKYYAIGEIGLDLYWDKTFIKEQIIALEAQINWALENNIPVILHCRESMEKVIEIVSNFKKLRGVFHAFTGSKVQAQKVIDMGFHLGIGGIVTFKNSGLDKVVTDVPLENLILETDSPYLAPVPYRGKRNEPSYLKNIAEKLSEIYRKPLEEVVNKTTLNSEKLFEI